MSGDVVVVGPALVIEIVEERGKTPKLFIGALLARVSADTGFDGEHVLAEALGYGKFAEQFPCIVTSGHATLQIEEGVV